MSSPSSPAAAPALRRGPPPSIGWRSWPLEEGGLSAWMLSALAVSVIVAVGTTTGSMQHTLAACLLLGLSAWRFFVPVQFELSAQGVYQDRFGRQRRIPWRVFESCEICREGVFLRPAAGDLIPLRGMYLPWGQHRSEVMAFVEYYIRQSRMHDRLYGFELEKP